MVVAIRSTLNVLCRTSVFARFESTLKEKIDDLGMVANDAVLHHDLKQTVDDNEEESHKESETDDFDDDGEFEVQSRKDVNEAAINNVATS